MDFSAAQQDMRSAYVNGGVGVLVSGLVWVVAGLVTQNLGLQYGMAALFFGGMAIHPKTGTYELERTDLSFI